MSCGCDFECGYINRPYCALRPFDNVPCCPKFSCPPPLNCHFPHNQHFPYNQCCGPFPYCCPPYNNFCQPHFPCQPHCSPCQPNFPCQQPCQPFPNPCCSPLNSLLWFCGGFRCGQRQHRCLPQHPNFFKEFLNKAVNN